MKKVTPGSMSANGDAKKPHGKRGCVDPQPKSDSQPTSPERLEDREREERRKAFGHALGDLVFADLLEYPPRP